MEAGEPPHGGNVAQQEGVLIGAEQDVERGIVVELVAQLEADLFVRLFDESARVRAVLGPDHV